MDWLRLVIGSVPVFSLLPVRSYSPSSSSCSLPVTGDEGPGPSSRTPAAAGASAEVELAQRLRLPTGAALRRSSWAALQVALLLGTLRYLGVLRKGQQDLWFLYFQPFLPMLAMLWSWATAVRVFEQRRIRYEACFSADDQRFLLRSGQLFQVGAVS